jgi:hypothetical protein
MLGLLLTASVCLIGCGDLLEVDNPGSITDDDIRNPESAPAWANGALSMAMDGWDAELVLVSAASDETTFVGPHGWWGELDRGNISDPGNAGLNGQFPSIASAQWMADETIELLTGFHDQGLLRDPSLVARVYLYGAVAYTAIADGLEDYAPSDRTVPGPPIGPENMVALYDQAVDYATRGLAIESDATLSRNLLALRARIQHSREVRDRIFPPPADLSGGGLVTSSGAVQDAMAVLTDDARDWRWTFEFAPNEVTSVMSAVLNCFPNMRFGDRYVRPTLNNLQAAEVILLDPIDRIPDPWLEAFIFELQEGASGNCNTAVLTVTSAREMHLIVAEDALARGDLDTFAEHVNLVREWGSLTPWATDSGVSARDLLIYERQSQLFLTGRRLADMYRFGITGDTWVPGSVAVLAPGTLLPISADEVDANCHLNPSLPC